MSAQVLYARIRLDVHDELRAVADAAGVSMAVAAEAILAQRLNLPTGPAHPAVVRAIAKRKGART